MTLPCYTTAIKRNDAQTRLNDTEEEHLMMSGYGMLAGLGWFGMIVMALFWVGVVLLVVWGLSNAYTTRPPRIEPGAEEILKQRFARGEISREELVQAREALH